MSYALITGASGGIGSAIASCLALKGYSLYLHYHQNEKAIRQLTDELPQVGDQRFEIIRADLGTSEGVREVTKCIHHPPELLIHNSGLDHIGLLGDMCDADVQKMIQVNMTSPILLTKALLPAMLSNKYGHILVVTSVWGLKGASAEVVYSATKGALNAFVKALAKEVAPSGVRVNGIAPGVVSTRMLEQLDGQEQASLREEIPMGRFGKPEEIAELAAFLLSDKAPYLNGEIISIDGAWW